MDNITNTHKKRLIKSWNKAIAIADQAQLAEDRKMEKIYREELERKKELQIKLKEVFVQGRENEEKRKRREKVRQAREQTPQYDNKYSPDR